MTRGTALNARLLIIDDEPANLKLLDKLLRSQGYEHLVLVSDPERVVQQYQEVRPDLILLDINMPGMDGYEVMAQLQALGDPLLPPIVVLTAQREKDFMLKALTAGARDFIAKPFDRNELLMRVRNLLDAQLAHRLMHDQAAALHRMVTSRTDELHRTRLQVIRRLGVAAEYRDEETGSHILRMSHCCALLARAIGWDEENCDLILNASPMHDIGKIGIPDSILRKPGRLTPEEWEIMQTHTEIGAQLLEGDESRLMEMAREIALFHHEKWDGSGYPSGLAGDAIPLPARIATLADVFDALTSPRPYKRAWTVPEATTLIRENTGRQFDPELVEVFFQELPEIVQLREQFSEQ